MDSQKEIETGKEQLEDIAIQMQENKATSEKNVEAEEAYVDITNRLHLATEELKGLKEELKELEGLKEELKLLKEEKLENEADRDKIKNKLEVMKQRTRTAHSDLSDSQRKNLTPSKKETKMKESLTESLTQSESLEAKVGALKTAEKEANDNSKKQKVQLNSADQEIRALTAKLKKLMNEKDEASTKYVKEITRLNFEVANASGAHKEAVAASLSYQAQAAKAYAEESRAFEDLTECKRQCKIELDKAKDWEKTEGALSLVKKLHAIEDLAGETELKNEKLEERARKAESLLAQQEKQRDDALMATEVSWLELERVTCKMEEANKMRHAAVDALEVLEEKEHNGRLLENKKAAQLRLLIESDIQQIGEDLRTLDKEFGNKSLPTKTKARSPQSQHSTAKSWVTSQLQERNIHHKVESMVEKAGEVRGQVLVELRLAMDTRERMGNVALELMKSRDPVEPVFTKLSNMTSELSSIKANAVETKRQLLAVHEVLEQVQATHKTFKVLEHMKQGLTSLSSLLRNGVCSVTMRCLMRWRVISIVEGLRMENMMESHHVSELCKENSALMESYNNKCGELESIIKEEKNKLYHHQSRTGEGNPN